MSYLQGCQCRVCRSISRRRTVMARFTFRFDSSGFRRAARQVRRVSRVIRRLRFRRRHRIAVAIIRAKLRGPVLGRGEGHGNEA